MRVTRGDAETPGKKTAILEAVLGIAHKPRVSLIPDKLEIKVFSVSAVPLPLVTDMGRGRAALRPPAEGAPAAILVLNVVPLDRRTRGTGRRADRGSPSASRTDGSSTPPP